MFGGVILIYMLISTIFIAFATIAFYIFSSIVRYKLAKKRNTNHAWLAWIPYANLYLLGSICGPMMLFGKWRIDNPGLVLLFAPIVAWLISVALGFFSLIPVLGIIIGIALAIFSFAWPIVYTAFYLCVLYRIFSSYVSKNMTLVYTLVSLISVTMPFFMFSILKKEPICDGYDFTI